MENDKVISTHMNKEISKLNPYLVQKILTASPVQLIIYIYDVAISSCARNDKIKSSEAVQDLINALNFEHKDIAITFYRIYNVILNKIHKNKFQEAKDMLSELRETWQKAIKIA